MSKELQESWERFLNPNVLRTNLITASIYIATFEILKESIIGRIRDFFTTGWDETGIQTDAKYQSEVLSKNRSPVYASFQWLKEQGAIGDNDISLFDQAKKCRNTIVHETVSVLEGGLPSGWPDRLRDMISLLDKIEKWWIINVEIPTDLDFAGKEIDESDVLPGRVAGLRMMLDIALGSEEESRRYFNEFIKQFHGS